MIEAMEYQNLEGLQSGHSDSMDSPQLRVAKVASLEPPLFDATCQTLRPVSHLLANLLMPVREYPVLIQSLLPEESPAHDLIAHLGVAADRLEELNTALVLLCHGCEGECGVIEAGVLIAHVLSDLSGESEAELEIDVQTEAVRVRAPYAMLHTALRQLCRNAIAAMPTGGRLTVVTQPMGAFEAGEKYAHPVDHDVAVISVRDNGRGFDPAPDDRLFEPFVAGRGEGLGVGLSLVYRAALCVGGFVAYGSEPDKGTAFDMILPAYPCGEQQRETREFGMPERGRI